MIDLYCWRTPDGWKISLMIEECGLPYTLKPVNIGNGAQFAPEFLAFSPNKRMPAIVDHAPALTDAARKALLGRTAQGVKSSVHRLM